MAGAFFPALSRRIVFYIRPEWFCANCETAPNRNATTQYEPRTTAAQSAQVLLLLLRLFCSVNKNKDFFLFEIKRSGRASGRD